MCWKYSNPEAAKFLLNLGVDIIKVGIDQAQFAQHDWLQELVFHN